MSATTLNPFRPAPPAPKMEKVIEHLATVRDLEAYLAREAASKAAERARHRDEAADRSLPQAERNAAMHRAIASDIDLNRLERACQEAYGCDPWKYEPVLLDTLVTLREAGAPDEEVGHMRGLIRAGSWMQYERMDENAVLDDIRRLRRAAPKSLDARLAQVEDHFMYRVLGPSLEEAVRTIEDLSLEAWLMLKKTALAGGVDPTGESAHLRALQRQIADLRAVRDALYFRRLYPVIAKKGF